MAHQKLSDISRKPLISPQFLRHHCERQSLIYVAHKVGWLLFWNDQLMTVHNPRRVILVATLPRWRAFPTTSSMLEHLKARRENQSFIGFIRANSEPNTADSDSQHRSKNKLFHYFHHVHLQKTFTIGWFVKPYDQFQQHKPGWSDHHRDSHKQAACKTDTALMHAWATPVLIATRA
jgi:hypothetical protein